MTGADRVKDHKFRTLENRRVAGAARSFDCVFRMRGHPSELRGGPDILCRLLILLRIKKTLDDGRHRELVSPIPLLLKLSRLDLLTVTDALDARQSLYCRRRRTPFPENS